MSKTKQCVFTPEQLWEAYGFKKDDFADIHNAMMEIVRSPATTPDETVKAARSVVQSMSQLLSARRNDGPSTRTGGEVREALDQHLKEANRVLGDLKIIG